MRIVLVTCCILVGLAVSAQAQGVTQQQIDWCANKSNPPSLEERIAACNAALQSGRWSGKNLAWIYNNLCAIFDRQGEYDRAIAECYRAISLDRDDPDAYYNLGNAYRHKRDYPAALTAYNEAIRVNPRDVEAFFNRALTHESSGNRESAIVDFRTAYALGYQKAAQELARLGVTP